MAEKMRQGTYCGRIEHLAGRRALLRVEDDAPTLLAQFDDPVTVNGADAYLAMGTSLNFGWHKFAIDDFDIDLELEWTPE